MSLETVLVSILEIAGTLGVVFLIGVMAYALYKMVTYHE